jgi:NAD(P)-dependent dehydrogenase (short-subunit alcohol dehydrogenase family)
MTLSQNQTMIITGASRGIGRALALDLAGRGVNVVVNARSADKLEEVASLCRDMGVESDFVAGDAADPDTCEKLVQTALEIGNFFGFVHAAAVLKPGPLVSEISIEDFDAVLSQVHAAHRITKAVYPRLLERGEGLAVYFGSGAANIAQPGIGAYCAAKAAMHHMMRVVAAEHKEVTCLAYRPGIVDTKMQEQARESEGGGAPELHKIFRTWKEKGELISPEKSAGVLADLMTGEPRRFHGEVADVDDLM